MRAQLALITGLSGSGKSTIAKCFEDIGYYCVDNLPLPLLRRFVEDPMALLEGQRRIAVVTDVRAPGFAEEFPDLVIGIDREKVEPTLLFLEASDEVLVRRFSETRRPHPFARDGLLVESIRHERETLAEVRGIADLVFDTGEWSIHDARDRVFSHFATPGSEEAELVVSVVSFGFKFGIPHGTDLLFDVRFLTNPYFAPGLRERTGLDREVVDYLEGVPEFGEFLTRVLEFLRYLLPRYRREHRRYTSVGIGCTGGRHRSVAMAERLATSLRQDGWSVRLIHRDLQR